MTQSNEINFEDQNIYIGFEIKFSSAFICANGKIFEMQRKTVYPV